MKFKKPLDPANSVQEIQRTEEQNKCTKNMQLMKSRPQNSAGKNALRVFNMYIARKRKKYETRKKTYRL